MRDLTDELNRLAPEPRRPLDLPTVLRRSRHLRWQRLAASVTAAVTVAAASAGVWQLGGDASRSAPSRLAAPGSETHAHMKAEIEALAASLERQIDRMEVRVDELRRTAFRIRTRLREPLERSQRVIMKGRLETLEARIAELRSAVERTRRHLARIDSVLAVPGAARP